MKILLFSDVHWSTYTSVVRQRDAIYSRRLNLLVESMNWLNKLAIERGCEFMICAGDMMNSSTCGDEELTALREVKWNDLKCYFLVGNHESSVRNLKFKTVDALESYNRIIVNSEDVVLYDHENKVVINFLPYNEDYELSNRDDKYKDYKRVIISHNCIKGVQYGAFLSKVGYDIEDIESKCDLFLNGHIHNRGVITSKIINLGSVSAHNFTNDSSVYDYGVWILDTSTLKLEFIENPYSLNFYKFKVENDKELQELREVELKNNSVLSISAHDTYRESVKTTLEEKKNILMYKIILSRDNVSTNVSFQSSDIKKKDHVEQFRQFALEVLGNDTIVEEELSEVCQ